MKRRVPAVLLAVLLAATLLPGLSIASGPHLRWNECYGEAGALLNRDFACDVNTGAEQLVCSYSLAAAKDSVVAVEVTIDLVSASPVLPPWWEYHNLGTCRLGALSSDVVDDPGWTQCFSHWTGSYSGGVSRYEIGYGGPDRAHILAVAALALQDVYSVPAGEETFALNLRISHSKTKDPGACAGCNVPVCLVLQQLRVLSFPWLPPTTLTPYDPATEPESYYVTWQGAVGVQSSACPAATPAQDRTWGAIKSLYR